MQVSVESSDGLEKTVKIQVPEEKIASEVESRLKSLSKTTKIQGFRPGKVPFKIIKQRYETRVRQEVVGDVVQSSFYEAVTQEKLNPAGMPEIDALESKAGQGLNYTAKFEVLPELEISDLGKLEIEKASCEITESDIDKMVEQLRNQRKDTKEVKRKAKNGDIVDVDFKGTVDGKDFEGGEAKDFKIELGSKRLIEGFEDGLVGQKAGDEVSLDLEFPEDYQVEELSGKPVEFKVTVNSVSEQVLPELNDEFFKEFGIEEGGEEPFRAQIKEHMEREVEQVLKNRLRDKVMGALLEANKFDLPKVLVEQEKKRIKETFVNNLQQQGIKADEIKNFEDESVYEEQANNRVALQLIIAELIKQNDLKADAAKVREIIEKQAESYHDPSAIVNWYYSDKNRLAEVEALALEGVVVEWISEQAKSNKVDLSFDDCMNKGQTETVK